MSRRSVLPVLGLALACSLRASAQTGAFMDRFLEQDKVAYGDASYLVLVGAGLLKDSESPDSALASLQQRGWAVAGKGAGDPLTLGEYALMVMRSFGIPGGVMYHLAPGPRYATRELAYLGVIQGKARPASALSGERAARILGRVLDYKEAQR